ncbi:MAG TPA: TonB-dependent receptor [Dokdonella sp.]|nr:TonB-dependent receptor [Dokdonella sp.]
MNKRLTMRLLPLMLSSLFAMSGAYAQSTSANLGGTVTDAQGQPATGAEVTITHSTSGTVSHVTTDAAGRYSARGLRVGGPYTITITKDGQTETRENVYLQIGDANTVSASLVPAASLETIVVTGTANALFSSEKMGTGTNLTNQQIQELPSIGRNIQDYMRLDPRIAQVSKADGAISAGGQNTRFNAIRIDGVSTNDPFGLESNNFPTERQPVSMDAIEEINIGLANYDVTTSGGSGAIVNAVTKSGTNEFHGSVYGVYRNDDMVGDDRNGNDFTGFKDEKTYGATFGGPLIKDTLFFFLNYEKFERKAPGPDILNSPYGRGQITDADISRVQQIARDTWGFDAGSLAGVDSLGTDIEEYAAKIDWNINESHRLSFRYSKMAQDVAKLPPASWNSSVSLNTHWYNQNKTFESYVGELFSDWSDNFSTELKVSYRDYSAIAEPTSYLPQIRVDFGNNYIMLGTEQNRHVNVVQTKEKGAFFAGNYFAGDHTIKFGVDWSNNEIFNYYGRNQNGVYRFSSADLFEQGIPRQYDYRAPVPGGSYADIPARFEIENTALFLQDSWAATYNLNLTYGVRVDSPDFKNKPLYNARIEQLYGFDNTNLPSGTVVQPRFGFNYNIEAERPTQVRGGIGLFMGSPPNVWISGAYQNTGLNYVEYSASGTNIGPIFNPDPNNQPISGSVGARQNVDIIEPGFKMPSVWKANLALDHELPWWGVVASVEFLNFWNKDGIYMGRLDIGAPTYTGPDGRAIFWNANGIDPTRWGTSLTTPTGGTARANRPSDIGDVMIVRNTDKGGGNQITLSLAKPMADSGWSWLAGYTHTQAKEVSPMTSSQNTSNWNNQLAFNANENVAYDSRYAFKHRLTGILTKEWNFFGDNKTSASIVYEGRTGRPYSAVFYNDINGDSRSFNDLFYVPNGPGDVLFSDLTTTSGGVTTTVTGAQQEAAFFAWLDANPSVGKYRGKVVPANALRAGWLNMFDVRLTQEIPGFMANDKLELTLDIMNIGNLFNKKWGQIEDAGFNSNLGIANFAGIDPATGKYVYHFTGAQSVSVQENNTDGVNTGVSRWSVQATMRYRF